MILGVHGVWNYRYYARNGRSVPAATDAITSAWSAALTGGPKPVRWLRVCYYSHLLHRGVPQSDEQPESLEPGAQDLLVAWAELLRSRDGRPAVAQGDRTVRARAAADWFTERYPEGARSAALRFCREVHTYQSRPPRRWASADALRTAIVEHRPTVLVAHSLGSVLAYETLWAHPTLSVELLVTLGSPLAMPGVVFDRLRPAPAGGRGARPPGVGRWLNFADVGDLVAVPRGLAAHFAGVERDTEITMPDWRFHGVTRYLASPPVRDVLLPFLRQP